MRYVGELRISRVAAVATVLVRLWRRGTKGQIEFQIAACSAGRGGAGGQGARDPTLR